MSKKHKYIESHWGLFAFKGVLSVVVGICMTLTFRENTQYLTEIVGWTMIALAIIEIVNVLHRLKKRQAFGFPLLLGLIEFIVAVCLLCTVGNMSEDNLVWLRIAILSTYVLFASVVTIVMGFASFDNVTDRFMWVVNGMLGSVLAFVMLADNGASATTHIKLFGIYLLINGLTDLFYGVHAHDQLQLAAAERHAKRIAARKKGGKR